MDKYFKILLLVCWLAPFELKAQQSFDNLVYWTQKKMTKTDMPITLNGVYYGNDLAKNLIYNSPIFKNYSMIYKPFSGYLPYGTEGAQGQLLLYSINDREHHLKFSGSSLGETNIHGQTFYVLKNKHQIFFKGNIYNQLLSMDRNNDNALDLPYRTNMHFSVNSYFKIKTKSLQVNLLNISNQEQLGLDIKRNLGNKYASGDSLSPFSCFQNQNLSSASAFLMTPLKAKRFWVYTQDISTSLQFKNYRETSILSINPYQANQTSYLVSSNWNGSYLKGYKSAVTATIKHNTVKEKLHTFEYNRVEKSVAFGFEMDKYWKKEGGRNNRNWQNHIHTLWRTEYNSLVGWIHTPGLRFDKDLKYFLLAAVYERNQRLPLNISEHRDWLMSNRKLVFDLDKPKLEQSDKIGIALDNFRIGRKDWRCQANVYYILTKNKWIAELNNETNEIRLFNNPNLVSDKQFFIQINSPSNHKIYTLNMSYRYDDIRNIESGNNQTMMLIPAHTGLINLKIKVPSYFYFTDFKINNFRNLNLNMTQFFVGPQKTAFKNRTPILFLTNLNLEFTRQLFSSREIYTSNEPVFYSFGIENLFNQTQTSLLLGLNQNSTFKGFDSYGPTGGRRFTFAVRWKFRTTKNMY